MKTRPCRQDKCGAAFPGASKALRSHVRARLRPNTLAALHAVIFTSQRTAGDQGYGDMAERMVGLAHEQPGSLGVECAHGVDGFGIRMSYWESTQAIANWKAHAEHRIAQEAEKTTWYADCQVRVAKVESAHGKAATLNA